MQCVSNACALVVTAAKLILHCIQVYVFGTVPRFTGAEVGAPLKFWAPVPKFFQDRYVYTAITNSAVPKNCQYGAKILGCRANFLVRVNGVLKIFSSVILDFSGRFLPWVTGTLLLFLWYFRARSRESRGSHYCQYRLPDWWNVCTSPSCGEQGQTQTKHWNWRW